MKAETVIFDSFLLGAALIVGALASLYFVSSYYLYLVLTAFGLAFIAYSGYHIVRMLNDSRPGSKAVPKSSIPPRGLSSLGDPIFKLFTILVASSLVVLFLIYFAELVHGSWLTLPEGLYFVWGSLWNTTSNVYGAFPYLWGSLVTSAIALAIGVPVSIGVAVFLSEIAPRRLKSTLSFLVEMLAAVPSVVYGLWGLFVLAPILSADIYPALEHYVGFIPIFSCPTPYNPCVFYKTNVMTAGILLSIMMIPIVSAISRDALQAVPGSQREAAYALGATKSEVINMSVLSYARSGVIAAIFLGFARAFGETMAVTFVIGDATQVSASLLKPGYTLASVIANQFSEASSQIAVSALIEAGLLLLVVSFSASFVGRLLIRRFIRSREAASYL